MSYQNGETCSRNPQKEGGSTKLEKRAAHLGSGGFMLAGNDSEPLVVDLVILGLVLEVQQVHLPVVVRLSLNIYQN